MAEQVFNRVTVDLATLTGARIEWELFHHFQGKAPLTYQLQVGQTGNNESDDWIDVGLPFTDAFYAVDDERRQFGKGLTVNYRIKLTDGDDNVYYSPPADCNGILDHASWCRVRELVRKFHLRGEKFTDTMGWLFKRRRYGVIPDDTNPETAVTDYGTGEVIQSRRTETMGTQFAAGYFAPVPFHVDLSQTSEDVKVDDNLVRGTVNDNVQSGLCVGFPSIAEDDVWVAANSDQRYYIGKSVAAAQWRNVPVYVRAEFKLAPTTDVIYQLPIPD